MTDLIQRFSLLAKRFFVSLGYGFVFVGQTKTRQPHFVLLNSKLVTLSYPKDYGNYLSDIVNVWLDDEYGLKKLTTAPYTIVDIGANIGIFSLMAWHVFPKALIHSYEPNPRLFESLSHNLRQTKARIHCQGVGSKNHNAKVTENMDSRLSTLSPEENGEINVISLSSVLNDVGGQIDLLKIDCEGGEWDILLDTAAFKSIRSIRLEYHLGESHCFENLYSQLVELDFRLIHHLPNSGFGIAWFDKHISS